MLETGKPGRQVNGRGTKKKKNQSESCVHFTS